MKIKELSLEQLKSLAYDTIADLDRFSNNLKVLNAEIANRSKDVSTPNKEEHPAAAEVDSSEDGAESGQPTVAG